MFSMLIGLVLFAVYLYNQQNEALIIAAGLFVIAGQIAMVVIRLDKMIKNKDSKESSDGRTENSQVQ